MKLKDVNETLNEIIDEERKGISASLPSEEYLDILNFKLT